MQNNLVKIIAGVIGLLCIVALTTFSFIVSICLLVAGLVLRPWLLRKLRRVAAQASTVGTGSEDTKFSGKVYEGKCEKLS